MRLSANSAGRIRAIERVVAALLLAGAAAAAFTLPGFLAGREAATPLVSAAGVRAASIVHAAPLPALRQSLHPAFVVRAATVATHARTAARRPHHAKPARPAATHPVVKVTTKPVALVAAPVTTSTPASAASTTSPTPLAAVAVSQGLALGRSKSHAHASKQIVLPTVQPKASEKAPPSDNGNDNGKGHGNGHDKGNA